MKARTTIQPQDLVNGARILNPKHPNTVLTLGPPKKKNVNLNVVNHCQLYRQDGTLASEKWFNMTNLRTAGFKYHSTPKPL